MTGTVHAHNELPNGAPAKGSILVTVNTEGQVIRNPAGNVVFQGPVTVRLLNGDAVFTLPPSDDDTLEPSGFTYTALEQLDHVAEDDYRSVDFQVVDGETVHLADLVSTGEAAQDPSYGANLNTALSQIGALRNLSDAEFAAALLAFITDASTATIYPDTILEDNPVAYWRLGEAGGDTAQDESDTYPGTYTGGVTLGTTGLLTGSHDTAATFDGVNDHVVVEGGPVLSGLAGWSVEAVVNIAATGAVYAERGTSGNDILEIEVGGSGKVKLIYRDHAGVINEVQSTTSLISPGATHHIVVTKDGTAVKFYVDGALDGTVALTASDTFGEPTAQAWLGADPTGGNWFSGVLDEVALYETPLSPSRVSAHYDAMLGEGGGSAQADGAPQVNPVLSITTQGAAPIVSKTDYVNATMALTGVPGQADIFDTLRIRGRGNLTWALPKKPFKLKLDNSQPMLGFPTSKDWALLASYLDKAAVNTPLADQVGYLATGLPWTPRYGFVDVFLNNVYQGNYQLIESVVLASSRVNATKATGTTGLPLTGAYLMEINNGGQDPDDPAFTTTEGVRVLFDDPDGTTAAQATYMSTWAQDFEDVLFGAGFDDPTTGYRAWVDVPSFIDWFLIEELAGNVQGYAGSAKLYKTRDTGSVLGKLYMGPLWDFDESFGTSNAGNLSPEGSVLLPSNAIWHARMFEDDTFVDEVATRWGALKTAITAAGGMSKLIDRAVARTASAQLRDAVKWDYDPDWAAISTYKKAWAVTRLAWMDSEYGAPPLGAYPTAVLADSPVSYWRLGETSGTVAADAKGVNTGTYVGGVTLGTAGLAGDTTKAVTLNGSTGHVVVKSPGAILSGLANWSIEAIIKPSTSGDDMIYSERGSSGLDILNWMIKGSGWQNLTYRDHAGTIDQIDATAGTAQDGSVHHVVITKSGSTVKFYQDGTLLHTATLTASDSMGESTVQSWIGSDPQDSSGAYGGILDEVAVYSVALSGAQVTAHNAAR